MALTAIDPTAALIVVDLQKGLAQVPTVHPVPEIVARSAELAGAFRARGLPVVIVTASGRAPGRTDHGSQGSGPLPPGFDEPMDELRPHEDDIRVDKRRWGAFIGTDLDRTLRARGSRRSFSPVSPPAQASSRPHGPLSISVTTSCSRPTP